MIRMCTLLVVALVSTACSAPSTPSSTPATVTVTLDLGTGTTGFAATLYAQDITHGTTLSVPYPPLSPPVTLTLSAPSTYVFYAKLLEAPDVYQFAAVDCVRGESCTPHELLAYELEGGRAYDVVITNHRPPPLPEADQPVTVPVRVMKGAVSAP